MNHRLVLPLFLLCLACLGFSGCGPSFTPKTATEQAQWAAIYLRDRHPAHVADALELNQLSAAQNNPHGQRGLGFMYEFGIGVEKSADEATRLYSAAAAQGVERSFIDSSREASTTSRQNTSTLATSSRAPSPSDELDNLVESDCRTRGLRRGTNRWTSCERQAENHLPSIG